MRRIAADCVTWSLLHLLCHRLCGGRARAGETGEHLLRRSEGEVVQHEDDFLPVFAKLSGAMDDKGRGHQALLLHVLMRMHPIRTGSRSIVIRLNRAIRDRRRLGPRKAVLRPGRKLPMPMHNGARASLIHQVHAEPFARREANAGAPVRTGKPEDLGRPTIHFNNPCSGDEPLPRRGCSAPGVRKNGQGCGGERRLQKTTPRERINPQTRVLARRGGIGMIRNRGALHKHCNQLHLYTPTGYIDGEGTTTTASCHHHRLNEIESGAGPI